MVAETRAEHRAVVGADGLQKNGSYADTRAVIRADVRAENGKNHRVDWLRSNNRAIDTNLWYRCYGKTNEHGEKISSISLGVFLCCKCCNIGASAFRKDSY